MVEEKKDLGLTAKKDGNFSEWYNQLVLKAGLADYSSVTGCMIIKPYGYAIWEKIQEYFNKELKKLKVQNAYFPMFIPENLFKKEAEHVEGFSPEVAWITEAGSEKLGERLAIRPTSETIMYDTFSKWIRSWRDLPLRINQWCNIVRWETKAVKLFIRSREFLWQEGHCVYATKEDADYEAKKMLDIYQRMVKELLAIPSIAGKKTELEKFKGALYTLTLETLMPDGKAVQLATSHNLGQNFARVFDIRFKDKNEQEQMPWQTSWGFSTRLIGAMTMIHSDDKGLVLPPKIAPIQIVIIPIVFEKTKAKVIKKANEIKESLEEFSVELDERDYTPGWKFNDWELKGVPIRIEIGPRDLEKKQVVLARRDGNAKKTVKISGLKKEIPKILDEIQKNIFVRAGRFLKEKTQFVDKWDSFERVLEEKNMIKAFCCGDSCELAVKEKTGATIRCIPFDDMKKGKCIYCGKTASELVYFSKSY